ncbi:MAG: VPLPA-CTERM sorting domain-containing protein, partial [Pseudomonadota bacterium]
IDALADTSSYAVEFLLTIDANAKSFNKLIDFQDLAEDEGFYTFLDELFFFNVGTPASTPNVPEDTPVLIGFERAGGVMTGFVNGAEVYSEIDAANLAVPGANILNFFIDDLDFGGGSQPEAFSGSVDFIRFHDDRSTFGQSATAVPVPAAAPLLLAGLGIFGWMRRRRKSPAA